MFAVSQQQTNISSVSRRTYIWIAKAIYWEIFLIDGFFDSTKNLTIGYNIVNLPAKVSSIGARKPGEDPIDFLHTYGGERVRKGNNSYAEGYESSEDGNVYHFGDGHIVYE